MVKIEKNSYYRTQLVPESGAVVMAPRFKDLPLTGGTSVDLEAGMNPSRIVVSGSVPPAPSYGGGELEGAFFRTYISGISISGTNSLPVMEMFKLEEGIGPTQGEYTYATRGGGAYTFTDATCDTTGNTVVTMTSTSLVEIGATISGSGIAAGTTVTAITNATTLAISKAATATASNITATFGNPKRGNKIYLMSSFMDGESAWLEENFDGADKELGDFTLLGDQGTATLSMEDAYLINAKEAAKLIYQGGDAFMGQANDSRETNLNRFFSEKAHARIPIRPVKRNKIKGLWTSTNDRRKGRDLWAIYAPYWKWDKIKGHIRFGKTTPATDDIDSTKQATEGNTIFSHISVQGDYGNVYTAGEEAPLLKSVCELSTEKKVSGGQSMRLYHLWQYSPDFAVQKRAEASLGDRKVNPQCTQASIHNIPEPPLALDMGAYNFHFATGTATIGQHPATGGVSLANTQDMYPGLLEGGHLTDKRLTFPEIDITMNISKLFPAPQIEVHSAEAQGMWGTSGTVYGYADTGSYTGLGANSRWYWSAKKIASTDNVFTKSKGGLNTLLRSVAITFSSYKSDPYTTLDEFLAASLDSNYPLPAFNLASGANYKANSKWNLDSDRLMMACGVIFQSFRGSAEYDAGIIQTGATLVLDRDQDINPNSIYAMALPMSRYNEHTAADVGLYASGGFAKFDAAGITHMAVSGTLSGTANQAWSTTAASGGAMTLVYDPRIGMENLTYPYGKQSLAPTRLRGHQDDGSAGKPWGDSGSREEPLWIELDKDSWFSLRFVFDAQSRFGQSKPFKGGTGSTTGSKETSLTMVGVSGGSYSYTVGTGSRLGKAEEVTDGTADYGFTDPSCQFGVPLRCYISGAKNNAGIDATGTADLGVSQQMPYLNLPLPHRGSMVVSGSDNTTDDGAAGGWLRCNNDFMRGGPTSANGGESVVLQEGAYPCVGEYFPFKYMTIWVNNYRHTTYQDTGSATSDTVDYPFWRGAFFNGAAIASGQASGGGAFGAYKVGQYRAADSKLYPSGLSSETEVFIDNITFKNWNNEHINHSMDAGSLSRFIKFEENKVMSPVETFFNTGNIYDDDSTSTKTADGGSNTMTSMMKGFNASGNWRAVNPGQFLSIGVDDPRDLPITFVSGGLAGTDIAVNGDELVAGYGGQNTIQSGYFLFNNFNCMGDFSSLQQLAPDIAFVSTAPPSQPSDINQGGIVYDGSTCDDDCMWRIGAIPFGTSIDNNLGCNVAGRNLALFNPRTQSWGPFVAINPEESSTWTDVLLRTKQTPSLWHGTNTTREMQFTESGSNVSTGWVINNNGHLMPNNTDDFPQRYSNCAAWAGMGYKWDPAQSGLVSGQLYKDGIREETTNYYPGFSFMPVVSGTTQASGDYIYGSGGAVNMGTGTTANWLSTDGFTQKGYAKIDLDWRSNTGSAAGNTIDANPANPQAGGASWSKWSRLAPRENILCAAKITGVPSSETLGEMAIIDGMGILAVDDTSIFNVNGDDRYVIFKMNHTESFDCMLPNSQNFSPSLCSGTATITNTGNCSGALGYHTQVKLSNIDQPVQGNQVALVVTDDDSGTLKTRQDGVLRADDKTTLLCHPQNLHNLWISPLKYWLNLGFFDQATKRASGLGNPMNVSRSYESVCTINERPADGQTLFDETPTANFSGSSFNEFSYNYITGNQGGTGESALLLNPWILDPTKDSSLDLQDYGYGEWDEESGEGGQVGIKSAWRNKVNYIDISGIVTTLERSVDTASQPIVLTLGLSELETQKSVTIISDEFSDTATGSAFKQNAQKPTFVWRYIDPLPEVENFEVNPTFDTLKRDVDLYKLTSENLNSVDFTWSEKSDGDIWYRMLMIDDVPIQNKYHKALLWIPLNEIPLDELASPTVGTDQRLWYADITTANGASFASGTFVDRATNTDTTGSHVIQVINGLAGYAPQFTSGSNQTAGTAAGSKAGTLKIDVGTTASSNVTTGLYNLSEFTFVLHATPDLTNGNRAAYLFSQGDETAGGFAVKFDGAKKVVVGLSGSYITGSSTVPADGETPLSIIVTYKDGSSANDEGPDFQLFINGKREGFVASSRGKCSESTDIMLGQKSNSTNANNYEGKMEEIIIYEKRWEIVEVENKYSYATTALSDLTTNEIALTHNSKLFLFDYHNIRGKDAETVCESNQVSWRTTA